MADKYIALIGGRESQVAGTVVSTGAANTGNIVALDTTGKLDVSVLPVGVGPDVLIAPASEALTAGNFVNIFSNAGVTSVRKADATNDRQAHGFVIASVASAANATVYFQGPNSALSGLTPGIRYFLGAAGAATATVPVVTSSAISQYVGVAGSTTMIYIDLEDAIVLA